MRPSCRGKYGQILSNTVKYKQIHGHIIIYIQICVKLTHPELVTELVQDTFAETTSSFRSTHQCCTRSDSEFRTICTEHPKECERVQSCSYIRAGRNSPRYSFVGPPGPKISALRNDFSASKALLCWVTRVSVKPRRNVVQFSTLLRCGGRIIKMLRIFNASSIMRAGITYSFDVSWYAASTCCLNFLNTVCSSTTFADTSNCFMFMGRSSEDTFAGNPSRASRAC